MTASEPSRAAGAVFNVVAFDQISPHFGALNTYVQETGRNVSERKKSDLCHWTLHWTHHIRHAFVVTMRSHLRGRMKLHCCVCLDGVRFDGHSAEYLTIRYFYGCLLQGRCCSRGR